MYGEMRRKCLEARDCPVSQREGMANYCLKPFGLEGKQKGMEGLGRCERVRWRHVEKCNSKMVPQPSSDFKKTRKQNSGVERENREREERERRERE